VTKKTLPRNIPSLTEKLASNPASRAFVPLADAYIRQNLLEDAIMVLANGIEHHPTYVAARMMLGKTYQRVNRATDARREFGEVVRLHPENVLAYKKLALLYQDAGQLGEAIEICNKVLTIDPHDKQAKRILALAQEEISAVEDRGDTSPVLPHIQELEQALPTFPSDEPPAVDTDETVSIVGADNVLPLFLPSPLLEEPEEEEEPELAFAGKTGYNQPSLHQIRLNEWLVSIQEKGKKREMRR